MNKISEILKEIAQYVTFRDFLDIFLVSFLFYLLFKFVRGTRAMQVIQGLILLLMVSLLISFIATQLELQTVSWIFEKLWTVALLLFIVVFAPEIRRAFAQIGQHRFFRWYFAPEERSISEIVEGVKKLSQKKTGALVVLERETSLKEYIETGVTLDSQIKSELLVSLFNPASPLHDGAVVIQGDRVAAAGCLLPLSDNPQLSRELGTRHRAALGITEETDAISLVVSEETGTISLAIKGTMIRGLDAESLRENLRTYFGYSEEPKS